MVVLAVSSKALSVGISLLTGILTGKSAKFQILFCDPRSRKPRDSRYLDYPRGPLWPKNNSEFFRRIREFDFPVMGSNSEPIGFSATSSRRRLFRAPGVLSSAILAN